MLKATNKKFSDEVESLKQRLQKLETENLSISKMTKTKGFTCYECYFEAIEKSILQCHLFDKHEWKSSEELDLTVGPRFCNKCDYQAQIGYELDGHFWSENDEDDSVSCKLCDESFPFLSDLMMHKKEKHIQKVSFCRNFASRSCIYGDENCWFVHEEEPNTCDEFKCTLCEREFNSASDFLRHRKTSHYQYVAICKNFIKEECAFGSERCWFKHESDSQGKGHYGRNDDKLENNETIQEMFKMMENMTKRITNIEKQNFK